MGVLTVVHTGIGLWISRETYDEILFPKAEQVKNVEVPARMLEPHDPILYLEETVRPSGVEPAYDLRGRTLDLRAMGANVAGASLDQPYLIALQVEKDSPAGSTENVLTAHADRVNGRVLLPKGVIMPAALPLVSGISFDTRSALMGSAAIASCCPVKASPLAVLRAADGTVLETIALKADKAGNLTLRIENLSVTDRQPAPPASMRDSDIDFAANYLLSNTTVPDSPPVPRFPRLTGDDPFRLTILTRPPYHLCMSARAAFPDGVRAADLTSDAMT